MFDQESDPAERTVVGLCAGKIGTDIHRYPKVGRSSDLYPRLEQLTSSVTCLADAGTGGLAPGKPRTAVLPFQA